ncbi:MAG: CoA-binding protein [Treponema sp.]|nr:CoA-binding protein [Treponema sp.]
MEDRYYFINPKRTGVLGKPCYPGISALPEQVDLIIICTPEHTVEALLREGAAYGVKAAVVYASGYGEIGTEEGRAKEAALKALCEELDIALMGPNCGGFVNCPDKIYPFAFISEDRDRSGAVGVISQSGQLVLTMMDSPVLKFSYAISAGNSKIVTTRKAEPLSPGPGSSAAGLRWLPPRKKPPPCSGNLEVGPSPSRSTARTYLIKPTPDVYG